MAKKESRGACIFCGEAFAKRSMTKHLTGCKKHQEVIETANAGNAKEETLYHLVIQDLYLKDFWLHLEINGNAKLKKLDEYLRGIWLECCGHLSQFSIGGWSGNEIAMSKSVQSIFERSSELVHIYDFGTSSETLIKVVGKRTGKPLTKHPIMLMARNEMPVSTCMECEQTARWLCEECISEHDESGFLCDEHAKNHPHDDYGEPIELVNSPRMGMCGYEGPAEPPY
ncbi:hypothetical protein BCS42_12565 [Crenothrix sp. D3]|nr:hypothetical protein BCS42_12565 [Crenothrix sp. D3]